MESNSLLPYKIAEEADLTYSFTTRHGITYHAYFLASSATDDYMLYVSLYIHRDNPHVRQLVAAFYDLVKNNLYPLE